ncbi:MAG: hypothetical protein ACI9QL_002613 [Candidatus Omnitrophota bacterium]|jgi:hypothetical protein
MHIPSARRWFVAGLFFFATALSAAENSLDASNSWALTVPRDGFTSEALLDLRSLNEKRSGEHGFIRLSSDKNSFVRGDGKPIRFWMVGSDGHTFSPEDMQRHLRWLAKLGVNMARLHVTVCDHHEGAQITDLDEKLIDGVYRFIKAAKDEGIYVLLSPYYPHFKAPESWGLDGGKIPMEGVLFVDPKLQQAYRQWTRELYTRKNPYTGLSIAEDPTVAILQVHNEDSLLFWTMQNLAEPQRRMLAEHFSAWVTKKHGSTQKAWAAWGDGWKGKDSLDQPDDGLLACLKIYDLTNEEGGDAFVRRKNDTAQFLAEYSHDFYASMKTYLREELGCKQLLNASNWRTARDEKLKALERYSYHALDIDAENEYVGSDFQHRGANSGYRIDPGDYLVNESVLSKPFEMCTNWTQEEGHPFIATETAWKNPNRYQSEGPFLVAAYQSLNGVDGIAWFSCQTPGYEEDPLKTFWRVGDQMSTHKWNHCYPAMMAGFPANALLFRNGYLKQADPVVVDARPLADIFARKPGRISDDEAYGDQRDHPEMKTGWQGRPGQVNRAAYQVGPVVSRLGGDDSQSTTVDLKPYHDPENGLIRSATKELVWDYHKELCLMDAPKAQGVTGFLKRNGGRFDLSDVTVESQNDYATINVVSLDGLPLVTSAKVLVQVVTVNRLSGYRTKDATFTMGKGDGAYTVTGEQIERIGKPPFRIENTQVSVTLKNPRLQKASVLDINGYVTSTVDVTNGTVRLPADALYLVLHP